MALTRHIYLLFSIYMMFIGLSCIRRQIIKSQNRHILYTKNSSKFIPSGTKSLSFNLISSHVEHRGASDRQYDDRAASIAWTRGPRDHRFNTCSYMVLGETICAIHQDNYNG